MSTDTPAPAIPAELPTEAPAPPPVRGVLGPYELLIELASGGMATVTLARAVDGRAAAPLVAIKRPHKHLVSDKNFLAMLLDEARLASTIEHENVVKVRELRFEEGEPAVVMDYVDGASLSELMKALTAVERAFDPRVALRVIVDALAGLHAAHELRDANGVPLGIVHRDISPHNILVGTDGRTRLTDFGIAQASDRFQSTRTEEVKGKLSYLAPERVDRRRMCTRQSDVFSMAIVLWECLAGRRLFRGDQPVDTLQEVMYLPIPRLRQLGSELPSALDDVLARALARDLDLRFATAHDFAAALTEAAGEGAIADRAQVTEMLEAVYGARMTARHELVRATLGDDVVTAQLFQSAGIVYRRQGSAPPDPAMLAAVAPPALTDRYAFGSGLARLKALDSRPTRWAVTFGIALGTAVGVGGAVFLTRSPPSNPPPVVVAATPPPAPVASWSPVPPDSTRRVVVHLPFLAVRASIDGVPHAVSPAADVVAIDLPVASGLSHHVVATALDGSIAETDVLERGGEALSVGAPLRAEPVAAPPSTEPPVAAPPRRVGVVRNGFTKLQ